MSVLQEDIMKLGRFLVGEHYDIRVTGIDEKAYNRCGGIGITTAKVFES